MTLDLLYFEMYREPAVELRLRSFLSPQDCMSMMLMIDQFNITARILSITALRETQTHAYVRRPRHR